MWSGIAYRVVASSPLNRNWLSSYDVCWKDCKGNAALGNGCDNKGCACEESPAKHLV